MLFSDPIPTTDREDTSITFEYLKHGAQSNVVGYRLHFLAEIRCFLEYDFH